ncbi:MAG: N-acetylmuramoyl-L-alanine amidase [Gammaproteobacteria bacterium]|nr:N-acetylmuramoyl-L-alanine amidase [Gammaproteobacteria bacterium]
MKALLTLVLLWPVLALSTPANLLGAHFAPVAGQPALVFDFSGPVEHRIFTLSNPNRIVIDFDNVRLAASLPAGQGVVKDLRSAPHDQNGLRVVLDLNTRAIPRSQLQNTPAGAQLVVNLYADSPQVVRKPVLTAATAVPASGRDIVVAIDAGHGGMDSGARGRHGLMEKNITLEIARRLAALVAKQPGFKPFLTRDGDYYLTLRQRIDRARAAHADIFVSIHCDASRDHAADGATVYALSMHGASSEHARLLAERENNSDLLGGVSLSDKSNMLASVLLDLSQTATIGASLDVGNRVARHLSRLGPMHRDDVQQAAFVVLKSPDIPSILVETDYITNPREASLLKTSVYQARIATAVLDGVTDYFNQYPPPGTELAMAKARNQIGVPVAGAVQGATDYSIASHNESSR